MVKRFLTGWKQVLSISSMLSCSCYLACMNFATNKKTLYAVLQSTGFNTKLCSYSHPSKLSSQIYWRVSAFCLRLQNSSTTSIQKLQMGWLPFLVVSFTLKLLVLWSSGCSCLISWRTAQRVTLMLCLVLIFGRLVLCSLFLSPKDTSSKFSLGRSWLYGMYAQTVMQQPSVLSSLVCSWRYVTSEVNDRHDPFPPFFFFSSLCLSSMCVFTNVRSPCVIVMLLKTSGFI